MEMPRDRHPWDHVGPAALRAWMVPELGWIEFKRTPGIPEFIDKLVDRGEARGETAGKCGGVNR